MVYRQQQGHHVRESKGIPMRTVRKNFRMMLTLSNVGGNQFRLGQWDLQDGRIVDTKIPSAILPCFSLRTECRGNELLMLHTPPPCSVALVRKGHKLPPQNCSAWACSWESGSGIWWTQKQKTQEQSPAFWDEK